MATMVVLFPTAALVGNVGLGVFVTDAQPTKILTKHAAPANRIQDCLLVFPKQPCTMDTLFKVCRLSVSTSKSAFSSKSY